MSRSRHLNTVPRELTDDLIDFCASISAEPPQFVPSRPILAAKPGFCFDNVARQVRRKAGGVVCGWAIWHLRGAYFEAEHHGVWQHPSGQLVDVSPQINRARRILFLPDTAAPHDPLNFRSNILQAEPGSSFGQRIVEIASRRNAIIDSYRSGGKRSAVFTDAHAAELETIEEEITELVSSRAGGRPN